MVPATRDADGAISCTFQGDGLAQGTQQSLYLANNVGNRFDTDPSNLNLVNIQVKLDIVESAFFLAEQDLEISPKRIFTA